LTRPSDREALFVVGQVVPHTLHEVVLVGIRHDLTFRLEEGREILLVVGEQHRPDARRLVETHVVGVPCGHVYVPVQGDLRLVEDTKHLDSPGLTVIAPTDGRAWRPTPLAVAPKVDLHSLGGTLEQCVGRTVLRPIECTREHGPVANPPRAVALESLEDPWIETDAEVLRVDAEPAEALHEVWERRDDEVELTQPPGGRRLA